MMVRVICSSSSTSANLLWYILWLEESRGEYQGLCNLMMLGIWKMEQNKYMKIATGVGRETLGLSFMST